MTIAVDADILASDILAIKATADAAYSASNPTGYQTAAQVTSTIAANAPGFLTGITSGQVTAALTFTPYNAANPTGYQTAAQVASAITAGAYTLPAGTSTVLGGVKPDGTTITNSAGAISVTYGTAAGTAAQGNDSRITGAYAASNPSGYQTAAQVSSAITAAAYSLPTASTSVLGGVKVDGTTVTISGGVLSATAYSLPTATASVLGGVKPDNTTITNTSGAISVTYGSAANTAAQGNDSRFAAGLHRLFITGTSVGNGADLTEDTLQSFTIPANTLANVGDVIHIYAAGTFGGTTDNKSVRIKFGGNNIDLPSTSTASVTKWWAEVIVMKTGTNTQTYMSTAGSSASIPGTTTGTLTLTDSSTIALLVTGMNSTNSVAGSVTCQMLVVNFER